MPIYEYVCTACDHRADILHAINGPGPNFCPSCGSEGTMRKLFAAPAIHYKGSGWAKKDRGSSSSGRRSHATSSDGEGGATDKGDKRESSEHAAKKGERSDAGSSKGTAAASSGGDD